MLPTKFQVNLLLGLGEEAKKRFSRWPPWWPFGFPISRILAIFALQVTLILPTKFRVNWPFGSGNEVKNRFSRWRPWQPSWISDRNNFSYFWSTSHPNASYQVSSQLAFRCRRRSEKYIFKMDGGHLWFPIRTILAIFDLQVTLMHPTKFRIKWLLGLGEEAKNRFSRWLPSRPSWIYDRHNFSYIWSTSHPNASYQVSSQMAFRFKRRSEK